MSDTKNFTNEQLINPYYHQEIIDLEKAAAEHGQIKDMLRQIGTEVITVESPAGCQDGVYTANWALVRGDNAIIASLPGARKNEEAYASDVLTYLGKKVHKLPVGIKFSGQGDALAYGDYLFCGQTYRSDVEAQSMAAEILGYKIVQLETLPLLDRSGRPIINSYTGWQDSYFYDIDLAMAVIRPPISGVPGLIAYCPDAFTVASRQILNDFKDADKIIISYDEAVNDFAANLYSNGETVIMSSKAPQLAEQLRLRGLNVITPNISEIGKGGGFIRCVTLTID